MIDELSLIQSIENEITRSHGVKTMGEAIAFLGEIYHKFLLKRWLERDSDCTTTVTQAMLSCALPYEVMFSKMLRTVPTKLGQLKLVNEQSKWGGRTILHDAIKSDHLESLKLILALSPESECLLAMDLKDNKGCTALHYAAQSNNSQSIQLLLAVFPESECLLAMDLKDNKGCTALHYAAQSNNPQSIQLLLAVFPESERLKAVRVQDYDGNTVLHAAARSVNHESLQTVLLLYPHSERLRAVRMQNAKEQTVLHFSRGLECLNTILSLYPESDRLLALGAPDGDGRTLLHHVASENTGCLTWIGSLFQSELFRALCIQDNRRMTVLHHAICRNNVYFIEYAHQTLPNEQWEHLLAMKGRVGKTPWHYMAKYCMFDTCQSIIRLCPESKLLELNEQDQKERTPLQYAVAKHNIDSFRALLTLYRDEELEMLVLSRDAMFGDTLVHNLADITHQLDFLKVVLTATPKWLRKKALQMENRKGSTPFDMLSFCCEDETIIQWLKEAE